MRRSRLLLNLLTFLAGFCIAVGVPKFERTALMKNVLVPADAAVKSAIYRLKAYDTGFDYPLAFKLITSSKFVELETLNCTRFNSLCQANVVLKEKLVPERLYDFTVSLENGKGDVETMDCSFMATNATTPIEKIFPGAPSLISISESSRRNSDVATVRARGNANGEKKVLLELFGPPQFGLRQRIINERDVEGTIVLLSQLDYEKSPSHHLLVYANDPWTDRKTDTRNIATWPLFISVLDEQDSPPVFTIAPPTTNLDPDAKIGDTILSVRAEDGDKGDPREVRYYLVADDKNDTSMADFFEVVEATGELKLVRPIQELLSKTGSNSPLLVTVRAQEVRRNQNDAPSQFMDVQLALLPPTPPNGKPTFSSLEYTANLPENSPIGTVLSLKNPSVMVPAGAAYILELINDNSTFEVTPNLVTESSSFQIKVKNNSLLDYESRRSVDFDVSVRRFDSKVPSITSHVLIKITDVDDDQPTFRMEEWTANLPEDASYGASVLKIEAYNKEGVEYTGLSGKYSDAFLLDRSTGVVTLLKPEIIHSEEDDTINLVVEVKSKSSKNTSRAKITINVIDVNDQSPKFERNPYEFIIDDDRTKFTIPALIRATDSDSTAPNNQVRYEMIEPIESLTLNQETGEFKIVDRWSAEAMVTFHARAYDGGIPRRTDTAEIRIYPPESKFRKMLFVVPGLHPNRQEVERTLSAIVGQRVGIEDIRPYNDNDGIASDIGKMERSVVVATVPNNPKTVVDVREVQRILDERTVEKERTIEKAQGPNLWWLFWLILIIALIAAAIAMLCCICEGCPWYIPPKKRFRKSQTADGTQFVTEDRGQGKESKSVQVAEWFGRREAWTPDVPHPIDVDAEESIRRHEVERGSGRVERQRKQQRQQIDNGEIPRDQLYIREGNADILRLITRGNEQQRPITLVQEQPYVIDSGKDILLRRFIDQQQNEVHRSNLNIAAKLQSENEVLEQSLRTQNALLRQILADREREIRLETQSLPAGTQTDRDVETQTEPLFLRPPKRKTRSDNEFSDVSDEETAKYRRRRTRGIPLRRKITTPIQEESENNLEAEKIQKTAGTTADGRRLSFGHTRTSLLRKKQAETKSKSALRREVLKEISASLLHSEAGSDSETYRRMSSFSDDSLEEDVHARRIHHSESSRSDSQMKPVKYRSQMDLREKQPTTKASRSQSQSDLSKRRKSNGEKSQTESSARYMEWYKKGRKAKDSASERSTSRATTSTKVTKKTVANGTIQKTKAEAKKSQANGPDHPLIQHSKNRFEIVHPVRRMEDDVDSGIALTRPAAAQKKSIFTIAYDDMQTRQIQQESHSPPL